MDTTTDYPLMAFRLTEDLRTAIAAAAEIAQCSKSAIVRDALVEYLVLRPITSSEQVAK